jgi:hypothetical protein
MPACINASEATPVLAIKAAKINDFVKTPPFPNKVQENLLTYISNKSARRKCTPSYILYLIFTNWRHRTSLHVNPRN